MIRSKTENGKTSFADDSEHLVPGVLAAVQAAMRAGFTQFTTPTPEDNDKRIDWCVRRWVTVKEGEPVAFLVAYQDLATQFEILGPAVELSNPKPKK